MNATRAAGLGTALVPIGFLVLALFLSVRWYGEDSSYGPNQIALMLAGCLSLLLGVCQGQSWRSLEQHVYNNMQVVFAPVFILLAVGIMIATWIAGGVVPALIHYGLALLHPGYFYAASCLVCAVVSLSIGSSWTTAASVGVALIGTAAGFGLSVELTAGAIISGAYFGDKMSPLSDTTNLAAAVTGVDLFAHIRHMTWTGIPALALALLLFLLLGLRATPVTDPEALAQTLQILQQEFGASWYHLLPMLLLFVLAWRKVPALPAILLAAGAGAVLAWSRGASGAQDLHELWLLAVHGYTATTGDALLDELLGGGGAAAMLNTVWLILSAVFFGSALEQSGQLQVVLEAVMRRVHSRAALLSTTLLTCIGTNIVTGDQYIAIVLPGRMYKAVYPRFGLAPVNLSRALEDAATVTSPLVPWNTCGAFMAATLGVATLSYLPWCFFNLAMPLLALVYAVFNVRIQLLEEPLPG